MTKELLAVGGCASVVVATIALFGLSGCGSISVTGKAELLTAAQTLTDVAFTAGAPALSEAAKNLPPEAQALVQAGYGALRKAVESAEASGIEHLGAQQAVQVVADAADSLHEAVHQPAAGTVSQ